jgi:hypothetical protein
MVLWGEADPGRSALATESDRARFVEAGVSAEFKVFPGGHELHQGALAALFGGR